MHRIDNLHIATLRKRPQCADDALQRRPKIFSAVRCHQDQPAAGWQRIQHQLRSGRSRQPGNKLQRINYRIARDMYAGGRDAFAQQRSARQLSGRKVHSGKMVGQHAVQLFRERIGAVVRAQPGFHMPNGNAGVSSCQTRPQHRGCVALHQHPIGLKVPQWLLHIYQHLRQHIAWRLVGLHKVQVIVRLNAKKLQHLVKQLAVLGSNQHTRLHARRALQRRHHRRHLYRLRARANHA